MCDFCGKRPMGAHIKFEGKLLRACQTCAFDMLCLRIFGVVL